MTHISDCIDVLWSGMRDSYGNALSGGKIYTYYAGTSTPLSLFSNYEMTTYHTNPVILDSAGKVQAWGHGIYKFIITDANDVLVDTIDNMVFDVPEVASVWGGVATGSSNAYVLTPIPAIIEYTNGVAYSFVANHTCSGASTCNISSLGAKAIKNGAGSALSSGDITAGNFVTLIYDSVVDYFVLNVSQGFSSITVSGSATVGSLVATTGNLYADNLITGSQISLGTSTDYWVLASNGNFYPLDNNGYDIGLSGNKVRQLFVTDITLSGAINVGSAYSVTGAYTSTRAVTAVDAIVGHASSPNLSQLTTCVDSIDTRVLHLCRVLQTLVSDIMV